MSAVLDEATAPVRNVATKVSAPSAYTVSGGDVEGKDGALEAGGYNTVHTVGKGTWLNAAALVCTATAAPPAILPLPYAFAHLGWPGAVVMLSVCMGVTLYTLTLLASLHIVKGQRRIRYRDIAEGVWGKRGAYIVAPFQMAVCIGSQIALLIIFATSLKSIYLFYSADPTITLPEWVAISGAIQIVLAMLPDFHSARWVNAGATFATIGFSLIAFVMALYDGKNDVDRSTVSYSVTGNHINKTFGIFNAFATFAFAFGNAILPEAQATIKEPSVKNMRTGIFVAYALIFATYFAVGIAGYWAYGNEVEGFLLSSLTTPTWPITVAYVFVCLQMMGCFLAYCGPVYEYMDNGWLEDPKQGRWAMRNFIPRAVFRTSYICFLTFISALLPFFTDFINVVGALGFTPINFVLPCLLYMTVFKPTGIERVVQIVIVIVFTLVGTVSAIGAVRGIVLNVQNYAVFANL